MLSTSQQVDTPQLGLSTVRFIIEILLLLRTTNPPMNGGGVRAVLVSEFGSQIFFFGQNEDEMTGDERRREQNQHPRKI